MKRLLRRIVTVPRLAFVLVVLASGAWLAVATAGSARAQGSFPSPNPSGTTIGVPTPTPVPTPVVEPSSQAGTITNPVNTGPQDCARTTLTAPNESGLESMLGVPCIRGVNDPTLYERYQTSAYQFHSSTGDFNQGLQNVLAGWFLDWLTGLGALCGTLIAWVFDLQLASNPSDPLNGALNGGGVGGNSLSGMLTGVVQALDNGIYKPFSITAVVVAGLYVLWFGVLKKKMTVTVESVGWVLVAMSVAAFFFASPTFAVGSLEGISLFASQQVLGAVSKADPDLSSAQNWGKYNKDPNQQIQNFSGLRAAVNSYWTVYVFRPWEAAEFGDLSMAMAGPNSTLGKNGQFMPAAEGQSWAELELAANNTGDQTKQQAFQKQYEDYLSNTNNHVSNANWLKTWYEGNMGSVRVAEMGLALIAALLADILLLVIAGAVIIAQLGVILLTMVAPLFFLVGIHPGVGRRLFMRWGELMLGFLARSILYASFLALLLVFGGLLASGVGAQSWLLASALQIGLVVAALWFRKPIGQVFAQVGTRSLELDKVLSVPRERLRTAIFGQQAQQPQYVTTDPYAKAPSQTRGGVINAIKDSTAASAKEGFAATASVMFGRRGEDDGPLVNTRTDAAERQPQPPGAGQVRPQPGGGRILRTPGEPAPVSQGAAAGGAIAAGSGGTAIAVAAGAAAVEKAREKAGRAKESVDAATRRPIEVFMPGELPANPGGRPPRQVNGQSSDELAEQRAQSRRLILGDGDEDE